MSKLTSSLQKLFKDKRILILGLGREGISTIQFLQAALPEQTLSVMDISGEVTLDGVNTQKITPYLGKESYLLSLEKFDVIFKTPSISLNNEQLQLYLQAGGEITSQLNEFLRVYAKQTIGVTGTKGKSTTTAFARHLLQAAGKKIIMAGNIGIPPFEIDHVVEEESLIAMEMSSYQLEVVTFSPHWAIWLNVFAEHLNFHGTPDKYVLAKGNITLFQSPDDYFIYNVQSKEIATFCLKSAAKKNGFTPFNKIAEVWTIVGSSVSTQLSEIFLLDDLPAILQLMKVLEIDLRVLQKALETFEALPHRLERISTKRKITFVDDTLATIPEATVAALHAFPKIAVVLLGGFDRGIEYDLVIDEVVKKKVPVIIFFKPSGEKMKQILESKYPDADIVTFFADTMEEAVRLAYEHAAADDVVLLSPASPSFGQYQDYQDKAAQFRHWIEKLDV